MRLWHKDIIPYLPKGQLLAQWRELNSIFAKEDNHILINYIYQYEKHFLFHYTNLVTDEMLNRGIKVRSYEKFNKYFTCLSEPQSGKKEFIKNFNEDFEEHDSFYLLVCYYNLAEKFARGQKDYPVELFKKLHNFMREGGLI